MESKLSKYSSQKTLKTVGTLSEFSAILKSRGYEPVIKDGKMITIGKKNVPEIYFINDEGRNVIIRASQNLWNRMGRDVKTDFMNLPVYDLGVDGVPELVIGLTGFEDFESVPDDISADQMNKLFTKIAGSAS